MTMEGIPKIGTFIGPEGVESTPSAPRDRDAGVEFGKILKDAIHSVDKLQQDSEAAQVSWARGEDVDLHDVLIKIEEAEVAFKTMMEVRNKLLDAYREVMRTA